MPDAAELEAIGFAPEDYDEEEVELWQENLPAFSLFQRLGTQWQVGVNGATGLRYEAVYPLIDRQAQTADEWDILLDDIQVMEMEALRCMQEKA